jgi:hypothetical protein
MLGGSYRQDHQQLVMPVLARHRPAGSPIGATLVFCTRSSAFR